MSIIKKSKDYCLKILLDDKDTVPRGLFELHDYFRIYKYINFSEKKEDDYIVSFSTDFRHGSIITSGKNRKELDKNIKDAILTAFDVPSSYTKEAGIHNASRKQKKYAIA